MEHSSSSRYVIGIDSSTTATKAVVFDEAGHAVSEGRRTFPLQRPHPGWHEQNARDWWNSARGALREAVSRVDATRIAAIGITHQRESFVCLDRNGNELRPAILWLDGRAGKQIAEHGSRSVHELSGKPPDVTPAFYKLIWLRENEPDTLRSSARVVDVACYLANKLTGEWRTSWASADPLGLVDMASFTWSRQLLDIVGLTEEQLPELVPPGAVLGEVGRDVAEELGLPAGVPVVAGAGDGQCAGLGAGVTGPGLMYANMGTALAAGTWSESYRWSRAYRTLGGPVPGTYTLETLLSAGSYLISWFMDKFGVPAGLELGLSGEEVMEAAAAKIPPGADGLMALPYLNAAQTPYWDPNARGAIIGWSGFHGRQHLYRALLEGVAFELRLTTDGVADDTGIPIERYLVMGGGSRSRLWTQIVADATGRPVTVCAETETTALGAAVLAAAAVGLGGVDDIRETAARMARAKATVDPDSVTRSRYEDLYQVYRRIYPALKDLFPPLLAASDAAGGKA
ncbi:FGGY-family carbohydrate kinase [Streptomyces sp. GbtcB6]|uniref:xylulokinase n=1 Tax=Streptomyces sp. GbtcB6 TaxID=2824751 RepID=UPI001C2F5DEA|nr:FGGY-family carbohydrate kinase [Streptomyces sp. GbtcB6]